MSRELWEKVHTQDLKPGDVVVNYAGENVVWDAGDSQIVNDNPAGPWHIPCLFRRIPDTEDPRVLQRLLDNIAMDAEWSRETVARWIEETRMELESEGESD